MAVGTPLSELSPRRPLDSDGLGKPDASAKIVEYDRYIDAQLRRTRRQVKNVDIASSLMLLAVGSLVYLMAVALTDHWIVAGGLGFAGRVAAFSLLAAGALAYILLRLVPLVMRRINPVYAAYTIERHRPGIKNSLVNFLLLRKGSDRLPDRIYEAMEAQAVNALTETHTDVAVDRTPVIRLLLALVAILICVAFYTVFSPKNPFTSFRRIISPWANVAPPTRVSIEDIQPGNGSGFHDQHVMVTAIVGGLGLGEEVMLHYSTRDGQVIDKPTPMALAENGYRHAVELPPDNLGLQQDLDYWITAGDAISPHYEIKVDTAPTIVLEEIEYQYPKYSELPPRKVARHGDIQALDGTRVTLRAKANQPIRQANLDFECDGRNDLAMQVEGQRAQVSFVLALNEKTRRGEHESYQLRFRNEDGHENPKPIRYSIEVIPDLPPEVEFGEPELEPTKDLVVPPGKPVRFSVQAADPDFKLAAVKFHARRRGSPLVEESLLAAPRGGEFQRDYVLDLKRLALKPGEQVEFWAAADDNREPKANHTETSHYHLRVATPDEKGGQRDDQNAANPDEKQNDKGGDAKNKRPRGERNEDDQQGDQGEAGQQQSKEKQGGGSNQGDKQEQHQQEQGNDSGDENSSQGGQSGQQSSGKGSQSDGSKKESSDNQSAEGESQSGEGGQGKKQNGQKGDGDKSDSSQRIDPERDAGKAIEEINKHFNQKQQKNEPSKDEQQQSDQQSGKDSGSKGQEDQAGSKGKQKQSSQNGEAGDDSEQNQDGAKNDKQSAREGATRGGHDEGGEQAAGAEKQDTGKQNAEKKTKQPSGKPSQQEDGEKGNQQTAAKKGRSSKQQGDKNGEQGPPDQKQEQQQDGQERSSATNEADQPNGETPQGEKQADKSGKQASAGKKGADGSEKGTPNEGGDKTTKDESGGGKEGDAKVGDEGAKHANQETRPRQDQGGQARGAGETDDKMKKREGESPDQKGGDQDSKDKGEGGAGDNEGGDKHSAPTTRGGNQGREKKQLGPDNKKPTGEDEPESSSEDKRQSDSQGAEQGDHDGGGKSGGGQRSDNEGAGTAGQNSEAEQGGQQGEKQGKGATGSKGGEQQKSDKPTGGKSSGEKGPGTNQTKDGRQQPNEKQPSKTKKQQKPSEGAPQADAPQEGSEGEPKPSDRGGNDVRDGRQRSNPTTGGQPPPDDETTTPPPSADESEPGGEDPNQEYARKATDLALQRLKDQLAKDHPDPELLKKLDWTREDMDRFYQQWQRLKKSADEAGPKGDAARQEFDDALRSLGLRPRGASLSGGQKHDDREHNLREDRRTAPPPEYLDQWREFNKSTAKSRKR